MVPTKSFTNIALYYKMMHESEPTPLATKWVWKLVDQKPMSVITK